MQDAPADLAEIDLLFMQEHLFCSGTRELSPEEEQIFHIYWQLKTSSETDRPTPPPIAGTRKTTPETTRTAKGLQHEL